MDNKERPVSIEAFINDPKNSDYINNVRLFPFWKNYIKEMVKDNENSN